MRGRPKKYRSGRRILLFLDHALIEKLDAITSNRSSTVNKLIANYIDEQSAKVVHPI